jgi:hypothetical protein
MTTTHPQQGNETMTMSGARPKAGVSFSHDEIPWPNQSVVTVTVSGSVASGKSAIGTEIEKALVAAGLEVKFTSDRYMNEAVAELIYPPPRIELIERVDYAPPLSFFSERYKRYAAWPVVLWCRLRGHAGQPTWGNTNRCLRCGDAKGHQS